MLGYQFLKTVNEPYNPKGCYEAANFVYFNEDIYGTPRNHARQICDLSGKRLQSFSIYESIALLCIWYGNLIMSLNVFYK